MGGIKLYIIIVTYNGLKWIDKCLTSVRQSSIPAEVILIDNHSTDDTVEFVKKNFPDIHIIITGENLGFGKANNIGMQEAIKAGADYIFLLNQDAYLESSTIEKLIEVHRRWPEYGVLSPIQLNGGGTAMDKNFKHLLNDHKNCYGLTEPDIIDGQAEVCPVEFVMAALWLISADCANKVGLFDPIFYIYGEDNDYLNRVHYHKFKVGIVKNCYGYHDRDQRHDADIKKLRLNYSALLAKATNINVSFLFSVLSVLYLYLKFTIKYFLQFNLKLIVQNQKEFIHLWAKTPQILSSRKRNRKPFDNSTLV